MTSTSRHSSSTSNLASASSAVLDSENVKNGHNSSNRHPNNNTGNGHLGQGQVYTPGPGRTIQRMKNLEQQNELLRVHVERLINWKYGVEKWIWEEFGKAFSDEGEEIQFEENEIDMTNPEDMSHLPENQDRLGPESSMNSITARRHSTDPLAGLSNGHGINGIHNVGSFDTTESSLNATFDDAEQNSMNDQSVYHSTSDCNSPLQARKSNSRSNGHTTQDLNEAESHGQDFSVKPGNSASFSQRRSSAGASPSYSHTGKIGKAKKAAAASTLQQKAQMMEEMQDSSDDEDTEEDEEESELPESMETTEMKLRRPQEEISSVVSAHSPTEAAVSITTIRITPQSQSQSYQCSNANVDNTPCDVCREIYPEKNNEMLYCEICNLCVHQACYGVPQIPEGEWKCKTCVQEIPPNTQACRFCTVKGGAMARVLSPKKNDWAHISCAWWIPGTRFKNPIVMDIVIGIPDIERTRWKLSCGLCKSGRGSTCCIQCTYKRCTASFHVTCALNNPLFKMIMKDDNTGKPDGVILYSYCPKHTDEVYRLDNGNVRNTSPKKSPKYSFACKRGSPNLPGSSGSAKKITRNQSP